MNGRAAGALDRHVHQTERLASEMFPEEQAADLAPAGLPKLNLQPLKNRLCQDQMHCQDS
jgi:hypothetical protein